MTVSRIPSVEGGIQPTILDAKGDLIVATGNDSPNRLAVGANNLVLTADSAQATGIKWADPLPSQTGQSGNYLTTNGTSASWGAVSAVPANSTATVATLQSTTSTTYTDLATAGPAVTITTGTKALVILSATLKWGTAATPYMGYAVSGSTTTAVTDITALQIANGNSFTGARVSSVSSVALTAGSNTFTAKYKTSNGNSVDFSDRQIIVINLG